MADNGIEVPAEWREFLAYANRTPPTDVVDRPESYGRRSEREGKRVVWGLVIGVPLGIAGWGGVCMLIYWVYRVCVG